MLGDLVSSRYPQVDTAFTDKGGYVCSGEEDEGEGEVLDEGDIKPRVSVKLDIGPLEEVEADLVEATLCANPVSMGLLVATWIYTTYSSAQQRVAGHSNCSPMYQSRTANSCSCSEQHASWKHDRLRSTFRSTFRS
jgi:hypothetical protein